MCLKNLHNLPANDKNVINNGWNILSSVMIEVNIRICKAYLLSNYRLRVGWPQSSQGPCHRQIRTLTGLGSTPVNTRSFFLRLC